MGHNGQKVWQHTLSSYLGIEAHVQPPLASGSLGHHQDVTWVMQKWVCVWGGGETLSGPSEPTRVLQEQVSGRHLSLCVTPALWPQDVPGGIRRGSSSLALT